MTPTERFSRARSLLLSLREDPEGARRAFAWPELEYFNWALDWFDVYAEGNGRTALQIVHEERGRESRRSFEELSLRSARIANALIARGVRRGDRILSMLPNVPELWELMLAAMKIGAVTVPAAPQLIREDVIDRLVRGRIRHLVADATLTSRLADLPGIELAVAVGERTPGWQSFPDLLDAPARFVPDALTGARDPLLLYFTSGTTAKPKLVVHTHTSYPVGHLSTMFWIGIREGDIHQNISAPGWAKHTWSSFFAPWNAGATIFVHDQPRFRVQRTLELLRTYAIDTLCAPPMVWRMLISERLGSRPSRLRELASAGEPLNPEVIEQVRGAWDLTIRDGYGQTETTAVVGNSPGQWVRPGSIGRPLPGYQVVLLDPEGRETRQGELALRMTGRPVGLMNGYFDDPSALDQMVASGYYRTGDEATQADDGTLSFVGRADDVFKSADYRISPFELESVLIQHPAVAEAAVVPSPDPIRHAVPKAFVALRPAYTASPTLAAEILDFARYRLAAYQWILRLEFLEILPKTISGKIRRAALRKIQADRGLLDEGLWKEYRLEEELSERE